MNRLKKISIIIICLFIIFSVFTYSKADSSSLRLNSLDFNVNINTDGSMDVVETWNIRINETNTLFKTFKKDNSKFTGITNGKVSKINRNGVEESLDNSNRYSYHVDEGDYYFLDRGSEYEVAWGTGYENSSGTEVYKISYHVEGAVAKYDDISELYWQFLGSDFEIPADKITGEINLPYGIENKEDIKVWGHTPDLNGTIYATSNNKVEFEVLDNKANKMVEIRIAIPTDAIYYSDREYNKDRLEEIISEETTWANEANTSRIFKMIIVGIACLALVLVLIYFLIKYIRILAKAKKQVASMHFDYFRDVPRKDATPAEGLFIEENKYGNFDTNDLGRIFSSTILNLSLKKALKIERILDEKGKEGSKIQLLVQNINMVTNKNDEICIYNFLIDACQNKVLGLFQNENNQTNDNTSITMTELKRYIETHSQKVIALKNKIDISVKSNLINMNILTKEGMKKKTSITTSITILFMIVFFGIIFLVASDMVTANFKTIGIPWYILLIIGIMLVIIIIIGSIANSRISAYTQLGLDEQDKWKAFKKYMEDFSLLNEKSLPDLVLWEKFLVYATAFGISEKVIKQLKIVYPNYDSMDYTIYPNMYLLMHMDFSRSFDSVSHSMSSAFSSGTGAGGGFSGGGGRWWRPAAEVGGR